MLGRRGLPKCFVFNYYDENYESIGEGNYFNECTQLTRKEPADFIFFSPKIADYNRIRIIIECGLYIIFFYLD